MYALSLIEPLLRHRSSLSHNKSFARAHRMNKLWGVIEVVLLISLLAWLACFCDHMTPLTAVFIIGWTEISTNVHF